MEGRGEESIVCVTHHIFLRMVASYIQFGEELNSYHLAKFTFLNPLNNAGITLCSYEEPKEEELSHVENYGWTLVVWNDYGRIIEDEQ